MKRFTAAVIGLGNVGMEYDYDDVPGGRVLSHANAFRQHPGFDLVGAVDPDNGRRSRFTAKFGKPAFERVEALLAAASPDVVAVAVPTALHRPVVLQVLAGRPKAILCEKPLAATVADGQALVEAAAAASCTLAVNYIRRFEPGTIELRRLLIGGELGSVYKGAAWYTKGVLNNGSHLIDLLQFILGTPTEVTCLRPGRRLDTGDTEPDGLLRFGDCDVYVMAGRHECFERVEAEFWATRGLVRYARGGGEIEVTGTRADPAFAGYRVLDDTPRRIPTDFDAYQRHVVEALHRHLTEGVALPSTGATALATLRTVSRLAGISG